MKYLILLFFSFRLALCEEYFFGMTRYIMDSENRLCKQISFSREGTFTFKDSDESELTGTYTYEDAILYLRLADGTPLYYLRDHSYNRSIEQYGLFIVVMKDLTKEDSFFTFANEKICEVSFYKVIKLKETGTTPSEIPVPQEAP